MLLDKITLIMSINTDRDVLEACAKTLEFLCTEGSAIYTQCDVARSNIIDECVNRYKEAIDDWRNLIAGEEQPNEDEIYNVRIHLKKVSILFSCHNLNHWNLFNSLFMDIEEYLSETSREKCIPTEALIYCIESCFFSISWALQQLENSFENSQLQYSAEELRAHLNKYMDTCNSLIRNAPKQQIKEAAYMSICDLLILFSKQLEKSTNVYVTQLCYQPTEVQKDLLNEFIKIYVFTSRQEEGQEEKKIEEIHKKRSHLAAFCKLIVYNILPVQAAGDIFKYYIKCYQDYGDIIKGQYTWKNHKSNILL